MDPGTPLRVALTGAGGMLGREVRRAAAGRGLDLVPWDRVALDVTDANATRRVVAAARADVVIHGAAWTDVDGCEGDPDRAMHVNGEGTANVARACAECGAKLVMVSTDYVFAGNRTEPWTEGDAPAPISAYGRSKLAGEEAVQEILGSRGTIARTAWVYADHGKNFVLTMLRLGREKGEVRVVDDQEGSPTFAADLAEALLDVAAKGRGGIYHVTNRGRVTWCGFARAIFECAGLPVKVTAVTTAEFPRPAPRPANSVLVDTRFAGEGIPAMPSWEDALARCLSRLAPRRP
ncbi:MAG: dTDP-4-dehydrorhamnose reductase [Candidatus Eiseniibacteriota bacterium]